MVCHLLYVIGLDGMEDSRMKFIKLTECLGNDETRVCIINFEYVQCFGNGSKGKDTHVRLHDKSFYFVKESVEEIAATIDSILND